MTMRCKREEFVEIERPPACFADSPPPALDSVLWCVLAFNGVTGFGVLQQQECGCPREKIVRHISDDALRAPGQVHCVEFL